LTQLRHQSIDRDRRLSCLFLQEVLRAHRPDIAHTFGARSTSVSAARRSATLLCADNIGIPEYAPGQRWSPRPNND